MTLPSAYGPLITPDEVIDLLIKVCRTENVRLQHLRELDRAKNLTVGTVPDFKTVQRLADPNGDDRQPHDVLPALLFFLAGTAGPPEVDELRHLTFTWTIGMQVAYLGQGKNPAVDADRGIGWYAMTAAQLVLQRTPRNGIVQRIRLRDMEPRQPDAMHVASMNVLFEVQTAPALAMNGPMVLDLDDLPDDPAEPVIWPAVTSAHADVERAPIQETP